MIELEVKTSTDKLPSASNVVKADGICNNRDGYKLEIDVPWRCPMGVL